MKSTGEKLVYMANQIGSFFQSYPHDQAVIGIKEHIHKFWDHRMLDQIYTIMDRPDHGLKQNAFEALQTLKGAKTRAPSDLGATG